MGEYEGGGARRAVKKAIPHFDGLLLAVHHHGPNLTPSAIVLQSGDDSHLGWLLASPGQGDSAPTCR